MWETYPGAAKDIYQLDAFGALPEEGLCCLHWVALLAVFKETHLATLATGRLWVTWLNNQSVKYGGRLVSPWPVR